MLGSVAGDLARLLKQHRAAAGLTQEELAERSDVSARTISDLERGVRARAYRDTAGRMADALGLEAAARASFEAAARGRGVAEPSRPRLPAPPSRLIGRDDELEVILRLTRDDDIRLVTVTGPGGIGKTRLALEAATRLAASSAVAWVDLGGAEARDGVVSSVARSVGVPADVRPSVETVASRLADEDLVIVLDTFEHVVDAAEDVASLLERCVGVRFLVTSREPLHVRAERQVPLEPLELPAGGDLDEIAASPAVALFLERATSVRPGVTLNEASAAAFAEICRRVDGIPLALELAAGTVKHFPLSVLRDRLERRLDALADGPRDATPRHRTMRDTIAWSFALLGEDERMLLCSLSVFRGGWTLDAASSVCGSTERLPTLIDKSLVRLVDDGSGRYDLFDVIREYAAEQGVDDSVRDRHLRSFRELVERSAPGLGGVGDASWDTLAREHDNIRVAFDRAVEIGDAGAALSIAAGMWRFWMLRNEHADGLARLERALAMAGDVPATTRASTLWGAAWLAYHLGDYERAAAWGAQLAGVAVESLDRRNALTIEGMLALARGDLHAALASFEPCPTLAAEGGSPWLEATSELNLGMALAHAGEERADEVLARALARYDSLGDERYAARARLYRAHSALVRGDDERATRDTRDALVAFWELDDGWGIAEALAAAAAVSASRAIERPRAVILASAADAQRRAIGSERFPSDVAATDGWIDAAHSSLGETAWRSLWKEGANLGSERAVDLALEVV
jgi:predicted ATPase/DNA-binding XRE family transcriptional regulator